MEVIEKQLGKFLTDNFEGFFEKFFEKNLKKYLEDFLSKKLSLGKAVYTVRQGAYMLDMDVDEFRNDIKSGDLDCPVVFFGKSGRFKIPKYAFDEWLKGLGGRYVEDLRRPEKFRRAS